MARNIRLLTLLAAAIAAFVGADAAHTQNGRPHFTISVSGGLLPIINGTTDLPDGTFLFVNVKKPWLPDGAQRVARGVPACGEDCIPAEAGPDHLIGATVVVKNGGFTAGPFSFKGEPIQPGTYPVEISLSVDLKTATPEAIRSMGTILYQSTVQVTPKESTSPPQPIAASAKNDGIIPRGSEKPSFDCAQAKTAAATLICADGDLATLDGGLGAAFRKRKAQISASDQSRLVAEQVSWIRDRNTRCGLNGKNGAAVEALASAKACMATAIRERTAFLSQAEARTFDPNTVAALLAEQDSRDTPPTPSAALTQTEANALRARLMALWTPPSAVNMNPDPFVITIRINLTRDRRLAGTPVVLTNGQGALFAATRDSALQAVFKAQPYDMLQDASYDAWKEIEFSFDPREVARQTAAVVPPVVRPSMLRWRDGYMDHGQLIKADWRTIEADNGAVTAVDMKSVVRNVNGRSVYVVTYTVEGDFFDPSNLSGFTFDCQGHFSVLSARTGGISPMMYAPPRSVAAQIGDLACAGASSRCDVARKNGMTCN